MQVFAFRIPDRGAGRVVKALGNGRRSSLGRVLLDHGSESCESNALFGYSSDDTVCFGRVCLMGMGYAYTPTHHPKRRVLGSCVLLKLHGFPRLLHFDADEHQGGPSKYCRSWHPSGASQTYYIAM